MSHLALQSPRGPVDQERSYRHPLSPSQHSQHSQQNLQLSQDSPTVGRAQAQSNHFYAGQTATNGSSSSPLANTSRSQRRPAPSPLHESSAVSPLSSASPTQSHFPSPPQSSRPLVYKPPQIITTVPQPAHGSSLAVGQTYYHSDSSSGDVSPASRSPLPGLSPRFPPNDTRSVSDSVVTPRHPTGAADATARMAGSSTAPRAEAARNSSIDSAISALSTRSQSNKSSEPPSVTADVANLIKTAGSAEAVIRYLLKEKHSQSQQNSQLWRLVDKQRAMILGLNKDLERALKDKEKYRKKLKEVMAATDVPPLPAAPASQPVEASSTISGAHPDYVSGAVPDYHHAGRIKSHELEVPVSPGLDSDSQKHSPIDMALAPYPITPPADQISNGPPSAVGDMLDPSHAMPRASEHALDQYDHEQQERDAEASRKRADAAKDIPLNLGLPPSRSLPSEPPRGPPPQLPAAPPPASPRSDEGLSQFPPPPAAPPRKLPPAPLNLRNTQQQSPTLPPDDEAEAEAETDSDYDDILQVGEAKTDDRRGRRRTREEDDHDREILARKEAEMRSLSKKSKKSSSSLKSASLKPEVRGDMPSSPKSSASKSTAGSPQFDTVSASLMGILNGDLGPEPSFPPPPPLRSPGLPASPRPVPMKSPMASPPMSPLGVPAFPGRPLSPRPPRQAIPLPPNTPMQTPSPAAEPVVLTSPKPLNLSKKPTEEAPQPSPTKISRGSPTERTRIYKGLVTEEYPDLLLPPNALPSINLKVASSRMKPSRASLMSLTQLEEDPVFTLAVLSRADGGELWRVEKDSASLAKLDSRLKQCPTFTAKTPDRSLFNGHAPAKLDARRQALDQYLDELLNTPLDSGTALELCKYLSSNTLPPNADETGGSSSSSSASSKPAGEGDQKPASSGRPLRSGYLTKRGKNFGGWKARFFVLDGPQLKYFETPGGAHLGTIKLQRAQIGKQSQPSNSGDGASPARPPTGTDDIDNQYRHAFLILEPKKKDPSTMTKHVLCAESDRERDQWVEALLRWIDYRDPEDEEQPSNKKDRAQDRQGGGGGGHDQATARKRQTRHATQQQSSNDGDDGLVGFSYDATKQGEIPQGAPPPSRTKNSGARESGASHHTPAIPPPSQPTYAISAPKDPQVISDSSSWGSKLGMGLAPPNQEEKKARKRSFFGFGPRARTSSDGQDSLFGSDSGSAPPGAAPGPVRQVFGALLGDAVRFNSPTDVRVPLPAVVYRCIKYLDAKNAVLEEGIFRLSGSNVVIKQLKERFNTEGDVNLLADEQYHDIHAVASLLKLYLRELPTTILTRDLHMEFVQVTEMTNQKQKTAALAELVDRLPQPNATLLKYLIAFLIKIINHQDKNKMTVRNVGIVFSPTLNIPAPVFAMFLQNYEPIFGLDPQDYELPSPTMERERRPSNPERSYAQERRPSDSHQRPSTSGNGSSSPHRQRLMEAVMEGQGQRGSPTPPPGLLSMQQMAQRNAAHMSQMRSTPTPPPQRMTGYEPSFLSQQGQAGGQVSARPAYESGFVVPPGYDPTQFYAPPTRSSQQPGYDRPLYESGAPAPYEQPYNVKSRRESGMFINTPNLNSQGSKSRLREEAQF